MADIVSLVRVRSFTNPVLWSHCKHHHSAQVLPGIDSLFSDDNSLSCPHFQHNMERVTHPPPSTQMHHIFHSFPPIDPEHYQARSIFPQCQISSLTAPVIPSQPPTRSKWMLEGNIVVYSIGPSAKPTGYGIYFPHVVSSLSFSALLGSLPITSQFVMKMSS